jgi:integrase
LFADFHSLRHSYITALGRAGVDLRTVQELAGHSSPTLTSRYSHRRLHDLAGAVEKLPSVISVRPRPHIYGGGGLKPTGTEV